METITFINSRGEAVTFGGPPFYLQKIDGLGDVGADIQTQKAPYQDGSTFLDSILDERNISVEFLIVEEVKGYKGVSASRTTIASVVNPKLGLGTLRYENDNVIREIDVVANSIPIYPDGPRTEVVQKGLINFIAPNPYWRSLSFMEEPAFEPRFEFPFEGEFEMGMQREKRIITNDGDVAAPLIIEFFGPALNPTIINNTTGEHIKVNQELFEGEYMRINTSNANKSVVFVNANGEERNVFNWIDLNSTFFKLVVGENDIEYTADGDIQGAIINIMYNKLYTAV